MKRVPFVKFTSCGNNFVVVDETQQQYLSENEMSEFARLATSTSFGVGCDNLLVIQTSNLENLNIIAREQEYWQRTPLARDADFLFRMFEPDGSEALCCGNGLICVANFLYQQHGIEAARIMTEIPLAEPRVIDIGAAELADMAASSEGWVNLGHPRRSPDSLVAPRAASPVTDTICQLQPLQIQFRSGDLSLISDATELTISGFLVFTGEPHLVIFPQSGLSVPGLSEFIFATKEDQDCPVTEKRISFGSWLVEHIGQYINRQCLDMFPAGLNVNFANITPAGSIENRCFERGINRETLACGTGALAVAYVAREVMNHSVDSLQVLPLRCVWDDPEAVINITELADGWRLSTRPEWLFDGVFKFKSRQPAVARQLQQTQKPFTLPSAGLPEISDSGKALHV